MIFIISLQCQMDWKPFDKIGLVRLALFHKADYIIPSGLQSLDGISVLAQFIKTVEDNGGVDNRCSVIL